MDALIQSIFDRHQRVALSFSGGRDSLALLTLMRPWWDRLTVYWLNPGNPFPETVDLMERVRCMVPNFKEVRGKQPEIIAMDGWPSDVVPQRYTTDGNTVFGATPFKVQTRLQCCWRSLMKPMYDAMVADGITCVFRGKRKEEADKTGVMSGDVLDGLEVQFPLYGWTVHEVTQFLHESGIEIPPSYQHAKHSLDCMDCTAWWGEGLSAYLKVAHPVAFTEYKRRIMLIKEAVNNQLEDCEV